MCFRKLVQSRLATMAPLLLASVAIFVASSMEQPLAPDLGFAWQDKLLHALAYFIYGLSVIVFVLGRMHSASTTKQVLVVLTIGVLFAASDEYHQLFVPGRTASIADWIADVLGVVASFSCFRVIKRFFLVSLV